MIMIFVILSSLIGPTLKIPFVSELRVFSKINETKLLVLPHAMFFTQVSGFNGVEVDNVINILVF